MNRLSLALVIVLLSAGCRSNNERDFGGIASSGAGLKASAPPQALAGRAGGGGTPTSASQSGSSLPADPVLYLAYTYGMRLELPSARLIGVMDGHAAACRNAGLHVCQLVTSGRDGDPLDTVRGTLSLRAEPQWLQTFMKSVQSETIGAEGRVVAQWTTTENLTREIVDTEATLRAKRTLRDRLQQLLATRPGSLTDLLGVERELSRVQGEIDSTESNLAAARSRVAMSVLTIEYWSSVRGLTGVTFDPLRLALAAFIVAVVESTATLVAVVGRLLPWVVAGTMAVWLLIRRRRRARRTSLAPTARSS